MVRVPESPVSVYTVSDSEEDAYIVPSPPKKKRKQSRTTATQKVTTKSVLEAKTTADIEDMPNISRLHSIAYHRVDAVAAMQKELLDWFESTRWVHARVAKLMSERNAACRGESDMIPTQV